MVCVRASDDTVASIASAVGCEVHEWTTVCTVEPNICGSTARNLIHTTLIPPTCLMWLLDFRKIRPPMRQKLWNPTYWTLESGEVPQFTPHYCTMRNILARRTLLFPHLSEKCPSLHRIIVRCGIFSLVEHYYSYISQSDHSFNCRFSLDHNRHRQFSHISPALTHLPCRQQFLTITIFQTHRPKTNRITNSHV